MCTSNTQTQSASFHTSACIWNKCWSCKQTIITDFKSISSYFYFFLASFPSLCSSSTISPFLSHSFPSILLVFFSFNLFLLPFANRSSSFGVRHSYRSHLHTFTLHIHVSLNNKLLLFLVFKTLHLSFVSFHRPSSTHSTPFSSSLLKPPESTLT